MRHLPGRIFFIEYLENWKFHTPTFSELSSPHSLHYSVNIENPLNGLLFIRLYSQAIYFPN